MLLCNPLGLLLYTGTTFHFFWDRIPYEEQACYLVITPTSSAYRIPYQELVLTPIASPSSLAIDPDHGP